MMVRRRLIRASEIGEYVYCQRAWWLHHVIGEEPSGQQRRMRGTALHRQHGRRVWVSQALLLGAVVLVSVALLLWAVG